MREDREVEVRTERVQAAPSPTCQEFKELRAQIAALTTKTEELQTALQQQPALAQPPPRVQCVIGARSRATCNVTAELGDGTNNSRTSNTTPPRTATKAEHDLTAQGEVEDHDFHPSRVASGPRCRKSGNGDNEHCRTYWAMPHSRCT